MKYLKLLMPAIFFLLTISAYADNNSINGSCPGEVIEELDGTTSSTSYTENGAIGGGGNDRYRINFPVDGNLSINITNRDSNRNARYDFYLSRNNCGNNDSDWNIVSAQRGNTHTANIIVSAGDTIYIRLQSRSSEPTNGRQTYALALDFTTSLPPVMSAIPDQTATVGTSFSLSLATYTSEPDGDAVSYNLTCLPNGLNFNTSTGLLNGTPTTVGTHNCNASATDKDGTSTVESFVLTITNSSAAVPIMNTNSNKTAVLNSSFSLEISNFVTETDNDPILSYTLSGTLPAGLSFNTNSGTLSGTPTETGSFNLSVNATDKDGTSNTESFTLVVNNAYNYTCANPKNFDIAYQTNISGDIKLIGNTNICKKVGGICVDPLNATNNSIAAEYKDGDTIGSTINSSSAKLELPDGAEILWAGMYWQGYFDEDKMSTSLTDTIKERGRYIKIGYSPDGASPPNTNVNYDDITADEFNWVYFKKERWYYQGFADVTDYVKNNGKGWYWGADINLQIGTKVAGGSLGAWSIAIAYKNENDSVKNLTVYHGYLSFAGSTDVNNARSHAIANGCDTTFTGVQSDTEITLSGFKTPTQGDISSRFIFFGGEGDIGLTGDGMSMTDKSDTPHTLTNAVNPSTNSINSSISDFGVHRDASLLYPRYGYNTIGIDIDTFDTSGDGTSGNYLNHDQNSTKIRLYSSGDGYFPGGFGLSTQLYVPDLCYDYNVRMGDYIRIPSKGEDINASRYNDLPLKIKFAIRSEEADFVFFGTKAYIDFSGPSSSNLSYNRNYAEMSPPAVNAYFRIADGYNEIEANATKGQISIGKNVIGNPSNDGGVLSPGETTYSILGYDINNTEYINTHFDIKFTTKIQFEPTSLPAEFLFSTSADKNSSHYIPRCPSNPVYDPIWMRFNIERVGSNSEPLRSKYTLHTQITKRPYQVDIASYSGNTGSDLTTPLAFNGTVELELIDAGGFENNSSAGYDTVCEEPKSIGEGTLISFSNSGEERHTVNIPTDLTNYDDTVALQSAAFRLWIVSVPENNGTRRIITHQCTDRTNSDDCFGGIYRTQIDSNSTGNCVTECTANNSQCYDCLKKYYAFPVCSRDNFSIRPESFLIQIGDDGQDINNTTSTVNAIGKNKNTENNINLAAGYKYVLEINATNWSADSLAQGYYTDAFKALNYTALPNRFTSGNTMAAVEFNDALACADQNSSTVALRFINGSLDKKTYFNYHNAGTYRFWLADSNWTVVDQANYPLKPIFDDTAVNDCDPSNANSAINSQAGCTTYSVIGNKTALNINFEPYKFNLNAVQLTKIPDNNKTYAFFNDFSNDYYNDLLAHPIDMATSFIGNIAAKGAGEENLTNFTVGCAAQDLILSTAIITDPANINSTSPLQQYLQHTSRLNAISDSHTGADANLTLPAAAFRDNNNSGQAYILLHTTFKKPSDSPIDPIIANYKQITAFSPNASSSADMLTTHIPDGNNTYDRNITYFFTKITPERELYEDVKQSWKQTPIYVDIYCSTGSADCNLSYNLTTPTKGQDEDNTVWYSASMFDSNGDADGKTDLSTRTLFGENANPNAIEAGGDNLDIGFEDSNASQQDINVSLAGTGRPSTVDITIKPVPWLLFDLDDPDGYPHYRVKFIGDSVWSGVGNTGSAVEATSNPDANPPRLNW